MIDEYSLDRTGWARFSDDWKQRFRLRRVLTPRGLDIYLGDPGVIAGLRIIVFIMLNPSTADAFKVDPTIGRCVKFAQLWAGDVLEVVNLHAYRTAYPAELKRVLGDLRSEIGQRPNNSEILAACMPATRIVAAWGTDGSLDGRDKTVSQLLKDCRVPAPLETFGITNDGYPLHPLARGKSFIPYDRQLVPFEPREAA